MPLQSAAYAATEACPSPCCIHFFRKNIDCTDFDEIRERCNHYHEQIT